jgi:FtsP/CotA-like multicopper oxidase with cupredoxin domain
MAVPVPGGSLDPLTIPKYVTPLVIPPVMNNTGTANDYDIAVRQFKQQILPGGLWATLPGCTGQNCAFPATTVWSYGPAADPTPAVAPDPTSQFNYPAYTMENTVNTPTTVDWMNELVAIDPATGFPFPSGDPNRTFLPHITPVDRSLHWANPEQLPCTNPAKTKDCRPDAANGVILQQPYLGPVPIITHVHGAHVTPESDGYPEAWWLPDASNIPATYATTGTLVNAYGPLTNTLPGVGSFTYSNDQPSTTLWYHDHTLGMTRNNVYAGPAGFWLIRDGGATGGETGLAALDAQGNPQALPGPAPVAGQAVLDLNVPGNPVRAAIREIPVVIQDRSFNADGSLFYPADRAFFEGVTPNKLKIPFIGDTKDPSDIAPIWNPEAFFNVMVVNGVSWPTLEVEPDLYRFRLLNGCNSRFLNLSLQALDAAGTVLGEVPMYQIGAEQSLLPKVVKVETGFRTVLPGDGTVPPPTAAAAPEVAMLIGLAERADIIVDFSNLPAGTTRVRMINTAPDAPFGGFPDIPADPTTTGQVMEFALVADTGTGEGFTAPENLVMSLPDAGDPANSASPFPGARDLALVEEESILVCASIKPSGVITYDKQATPDPANPGTCVDKNGRLRASVPFAPKAAVLGINGSSPAPTVTLWSDPIATNPAVGATETWELWNWTVDGHPVHLHLVKFKVVNREAFDPLTGALTGVVNPPEATEAGWKDTVIAYPGEVTRVNATFDLAGLYVWHCHIVEHEDNEMMVPYCVGDQATAPGCSVVP